MSRWDRLCHWIRNHLPDAEHRVRDLPYFQSFEGYGDSEGVQAYSPHDFDHPDELEEDWGLIEKAEREQDARGAV